MSWGPRDRPSRAGGNGFRTAVWPASIRSTRAARAVLQLPKCSRGSSDARCGSPRKQHPLELSEDGGGAGREQIDRAAIWAQDSSRLNQVEIWFGNSARCNLARGFLLGRRPRSQTAQTIYALTPNPPNRSGGPTPIPLVALLRHQERNERDTSPGPRVVERGDLARSLPRVRARSYPPFEIFRSAKIFKIPYMHAGWPRYERRAAMPRRPCVRFPTRPHVHTGGGVNSTNDWRLQVAQCRGDRAPALPPAPPQR